MEQHNVVKYFLKEKEYRGSPTYAVFTTADPTTAVFWLIYMQVGNFCVSRHGPNNANFA